MKQHLWAVNSFLLSLLAVTIAGMLALQQPVPRHTPAVLPETKLEKIATLPALEELYGPNDLFGLFTAPTAPAIKTIEIPKPPQFTAPPTPPTPKSAALKLVPPLSISISGIIFSPKRPDRSVAMISDDTNKEMMYRLGDTIKDGMIIKITQDRVVILRSNGQQETFFLRKDITLESLNEKAEKTADGDAEKLATTTGENTYDLSLEIFGKKVQSLGDFLQEFDLMPIYRQNVIKGFKVTSSDAGSFPATLGFSVGDVITKINDIDVASIENRVKIYDMLTTLPPSKKVTVTAVRNQKEVNKIISLIERHKPKMIAQPSSQKLPAFAKTPDYKPTSHMSEATYNEMIESMRSQLAENMHARAYSSRIP